MALPIHCYRSVQSLVQIPKVLVCLVLALSFVMPPVALADYKPPSSSRPSTPTGSTGTRTGSCSEVTKGTLTTLAPVGHQGQTTATHPTFAWYVPDAQSYPIEFRLYSRDGNRYILNHEQRVQSVKGIQSYTLPQDRAGLTVGQTYLWQVTLLCDGSDPSKDQLARADVAIVAAPAQIQSLLAKALLTKPIDRQQRANLYAESGFWYDALAEALADTKAKSLKLSLLADLVKLEALSQAEMAQKQSDRLKQVIELEQ